VQKLLDEFVCVRLVHANGLDLNLFQYDYDQSFAAFMMNGDKTIYGRFGTRSHETESEDDVSVEGFARALEGALALHQQYPANKSSLAAKHGSAAAVPVPEEFPMLKGKFGPKLDYQGNVVKSCIHCHQVGEAMRLFYHDQNKPIPESVLYPYPHPKTLGLILDPKEKAVVREVTAGSPAAKDGFRAGDEIISLAGQPLLSIADVQWVLHQAGDSGKLAAEVLRDGRKQQLALTLSPGWRRTGDISWRATSWDLRRIATGGMKLEEIEPAELKQLGLDAGKLALRVKHVGQYGDHAAAKNAGFRKDDVVVSLDGKSDPLNESQWLATLANTKRRGDKVPVTVLRDGKRVELKLPIQ
jgi:serine protease Do